MYGYDQAEEFDPVMYNGEENEFLIENLGKSREVATARGIPHAVGRMAIDFLDRVYRLQEGSKLSGESWCGVEALVGASKTWLVESKKWEENAKRGAPRFPSMGAWDLNGKYYHGGAGADSGRVRTYFDSEGNRVPFAVGLFPIDQAYVPEWLQKRKDEGKARIFTELVHDEEHGFVQCPICKHTQNYPPGIRTKYNQARARMAKHLKTAKGQEADAHRQLYTYAFAK